MDAVVGHVAFTLTIATNVVNGIAMTIFARIFFDAPFVCVTEAGRMEECYPSFLKRRRYKNVVNR
ncbi:MAG: hypothetical protein ACE5NG_08165 [bacterium]